MPNKPKKPNTPWSLVHDNIMNINNSKLFAGLMIITLNIASKFVTFKLGKTAETYLKYTFSRQILVFAMAWMGTRDIYVAAGLTIIFIILFDFLFNENSMFCILPNDLKEHYENVAQEHAEITHEAYVNAQSTVQKYTEQKEKEKEK